jgi:hypothetical protein
MTADLTRGLERLDALIASIDRAGDHALVLGLLVVVAALAGLVYGLVQLAGKMRAGRPRAHRAPEEAEGPET